MLGVRDAVHGCVAVGAGSPLPDELSYDLLSRECAGRVELSGSPCAAAYTPAACDRAVYGGHTESVLDERVAALGAGASEETWAGRFGNGRLPRARRPEPATPVVIGEFATQPPRDVGAARAGACVPILGLVPAGLTLDSDPADYTVHCSGLVGCPRSCAARSACGTVRCCRACVRSRRSNRYDEW